jgi:hypothetical protein
MTSLAGIVAIGGSVLEGRKGFEPPALEKSVGPRVNVLISTFWQKLFEKVMTL